MVMENLTKFINISSFQTSVKIIDRARELEIKLELKKKRKASQVQTLVVLEN